MEKIDLINGSFELCGALLYIINIFRIIKDKRTQGISWIPTLFFTVWGAWNIYYYPNLNQIFSFWGGLSLFTVNIIWVSLVFYFKNKRNKKNIIYVPLIAYPIAHEDVPICDYTIQGFSNEQDARDLYPDAIICPIEFPEK